MVLSRRGIHSTDHVERNPGNIQLQQKCCICGEPDSIEGNIEENDEQLENQLTTNFEHHGKNDLDLSEKTNFTCKKCKNNIQKNQHGTTQKSSKAVILLILMTVPLGCIALYFNYWNFSNTEFDVNVHNQTQEEIAFDNELYGLEDIYKEQEERVWYTFAAGIKSVIAEQPYKPSVFLLLYDNDQAENTVKCLAKDVTRAASKYLMKREIKPLMLTGKELNQESILKDPGQLLVLYENSVKTHGSMIVTSLQDVHPKIAASFHFFCDRYTPLVEKAIYFFALKVKSVSSTSLQKVAEEALQNLWAKDLPENIVHPLITRMTGNVIKIFKDYNNCYL